MKNQTDLQGVAQGKQNDEETSLSDSGQGDGGDIVAKYTYPLDPERKKRIAEAFQRRIDLGVPTEVGRRGGW